MTEDDMIGWYQQLNGYELEQAEGDDEGQRSLMCCSPWDCKESDTTERLQFRCVCVCVYIYIYPFSCLKSFPALGSFPMNQIFPSGGQSIGVSASASVLPMNIQDLFPLGLIDLIFLKSKGLSKVFSNTTVQKHQFFSSQLSLLSNSHIHM